MQKLSVDQALIKAKSYIKKNEITEAKKLYQAVLLTFPKNIRIQKELATLNKYQQTNVIQSLPKETIANLVNLYNQGQYEAVVEQAQSLTNQYSQVYIIWNILGAANKGLFPGNMELVKASMLAGLLIRYDEDVVLCSKIEEAIFTVQKSDILSNQSCDNYKQKNTISNILSINPSLGFMNYIQ